MLLPRVTLLPCDLPLVKQELQAQNEVLKLIDEALVNESTSIQKVSKLLYIVVYEYNLYTQLREELVQLRGIILNEVDSWITQGIYSTEFLNLFLNDIKAIESDARNKVGSELIGAIESEIFAHNNGKYMDPIVMFYFS